MSHKDAKVCRDLIRFWHARNLSPDSIVRQLRDGCPDCGMRHVRRELARMENRSAINATIAARAKS